MKETAHYIVQILIFVAIILTVGTFGYLLIEEGIKVTDAFYMAVTAITPTQFDEVHELSVGGRYFTVVLVFCGFGAVVAFATQFARLVIQSELEGVGVITRKQMRRRIRKMKNHYIVCGYGEIGSAICAELKEHRFPFVVITDSEASIAAIDREGYALVRGNPTADTSLKEAGIDRAFGVIAVLADDSNNLFISLAARELNPKVFIIARGEDSSVEDRILRAGADIVVSPMKLGGQQIAELIKQQAGASSLVIGSAPQATVLGLGLTSYTHTVETPITVAQVLERFGAVGAAGIRRRDGEFESSPSPDVSVRRDDTLVLITRVEDTGEPFHKEPSGKTILLADDHRALRLLFTRKLASAGHDVIQAATGDDAIRMAESHSPSLIVLDVNMPKRNGYEVCAALRQDARFTGTPIILYSGEETDEFVDRGRAAGADMCIRKTSKSSDLLARIEEAFSQPRTSANPDDTPATEIVPSRSGTAHAANGGLDLAVAMGNADGDAALFAQLANAVLEETPPLMERMQTALAESDHEMLRVAAHTLKSSIAIVGATEASELAAKIELAGSHANLDQARILYSSLEPRIESFTAALRRHCTEHPVS